MSYLVLLAEEAEEAPKGFNSFFKRGNPLRVQQFAQAGEPCHRNCFTANELFHRVAVRSRNAFEVSRGLQERGSSVGFPDQEQVSLRADAGSAHSPFSKDASRLSKGTSSKTTSAHPKRSSELSFSQRENNYCKLSVYRDNRGF